MLVLVAHLEESDMKYMVLVSLVLGYMSLTGCVSDQAMKSQEDMRCPKNEVCHHGHHHHNSRRHHEKYFRGDVE